MVVMDFPSDSGESVRQRIVASARVMGHRRIPVIPGQLSPALTPYRHQRRVAAHNRAAARLALPAPDDADEEEIEPENDTRSDLPGDFVKGPRGRR
jgi:hypothetical protein